MTAGLQRGDQPAAVQGARVCAGRPTTACPTRRTATRLDDRRSAASGSSCIHDRGETDDATWVWAPGAQGAVRGRHVHLGVARTAATRRRCSATRATGRSRSARWSRSSPRCCCPGHGLPIVGADRVRQALTEGAELLESLVEQTLAMMNEGARLDDIVHTRARARRISSNGPYLQRDLRRARVRRAQHLAPVRRLVRRRPVAPEARARRRARRASSPTSRAARPGSPSARARARGRRRPAPRRSSRRARGAGRARRQGRARGARRGVRRARRRRGVDDVEGHLLVGRARVASEGRRQHDEDRGREHPRHRRVVGHRRRARADPRRARARPSASSPGAPTASRRCSSSAGSTRPDSRMWAADLGDLARAEQVALEAWDAFGGLDVLVNNAAIPKRTRVTDLTPADVRARDGRRLPLPRAHGARGAAAHARARASGRSCSCRAWAAASRSRTSRRTTRRSTRCAGSRRRCYLDLAGTRRRREARAARARSTPRSGTSPTTSPRSSTSRRCPPRSARPASPTRSPTTASSTTCRRCSPAASTPRRSRSARSQHCDDYLRGMADMARSDRGVATD